MAKRSIYSSRQRMAPGQYETPLADFLDQLPGYINQYQQNQLTLNKRKLEERRYNNSILRQTRLDNESKTQKEYQSEVDAIKLLPESLRAGAYATSNIPRLKAIGTKIKEDESSFNDLLNREDIDYINNPVKEIKSLRELLLSPEISKYPNRVDQINEKIKILTPIASSKEVENFIKNNPNDLRVPELTSLYKINPVKALESISPTRSTKSTIQRNMYNPTTKEYIALTDSEIAERKATEDTKDDVVFASTLPKKSSSQKYTLGQLNESYAMIQDRLNPRKRKNVLGLNDITLEEKNKLEEQLRNIDLLRDKIFSPLESNKQIIEY